jgi:hypothetical protein
MVARLAAQGRPNPEIGSQPPPHRRVPLRKVFTKLGISSRRSLRDALRDSTPGSHVGVTGPELECYSLSHRGVT